MEFTDKARNNKIVRKQNTAHDALKQVLTRRMTEWQVFNYDLDTRWDNVTVFTTIEHDGKRYRLSLEEEVD
jgi:hypothetical protein